MTTVAAIGPNGSEGFLAAGEFMREASIVLTTSMAELSELLKNKSTDYALLPVYNTREGIINESFQAITDLKEYSWTDNVLLPLHLSLGSLTDSGEITTIVGRGTVFTQCREYIRSNFPEATLLIQRDIESKIIEIRDNNLTEYAVIDSEALLTRHRLILREREVVSHNKTRFAVLSRKGTGPTGFDATALLTKPLNDRVGLLVDILNNFTQRGISITDLRSENDIVTQKLQIYLELEGHHSDPNVKEAIAVIESSVLQERGAVRILGSFPRIEMRTKSIKAFGFIGTGDMSRWFAKRLEHEGYETILTGRHSETTPEQMIASVDVVMICVPISVTSETIKRYAGLLRPGQALILLAGESEKNLQTAMEYTDEGVELMHVHNLWGPQTATMKDKNVSVIRTKRSGKFCSEFEAFLYKHGAEISYDSPVHHDIMMGVGQKLPTLISVALAATLKKHGIGASDIKTHATLTSIYGILALARVHNQNPRTYAEIMATGGEGERIVQTFAGELANLVKLSDQKQIEELCSRVEENRAALGDEFLQNRMQQARAVDRVLKDSGLQSG